MCDVEYVSSNSYSVQAGRLMATARRANWDKITDNSLTMQHNFSRYNLQLQERIMNQLQSDDRTKGAGLLHHWITFLYKTTKCE